MMYSIEILAAFNFLGEETKVGTLEYERVKGGASYRFSYEKAFLSAFPKVNLSADLGRYLGVQAASDHLFSFLGDALPDRWGRALIDKKEHMDAKKDRRLPRTFDDFGYLVRIDDFSRMGALRLKYNGKYLGQENGQRNVPPIAELETFIREAHLLEEAERKNLTPQDTWLKNLWIPGSSLGGARPKLSIIDTDGNLLIAKIPSMKDTYDIGLWEHFACTLARTAGIKTAESRVLRAGPTPYHTLLSKRFDRDADKRIHFASSLTLTGLRDGAGATDGKGYIDIADAMAGDFGINNLSRNTSELFRRIVYNILIGNHDDHFRNHGFLLRPDGWELSPAYDLNPSLERTQVLAISSYSNQSSVKELYDSSDYYLLSKKEAEEIVEEVTGAVEQWRQVAKNVRIPPAEQERFSERFDWALAQTRSVFPKKATVNIPVPAVAEEPAGKTFEETATERIKKQYPGIQFTGRFPLKTIGKETGLLLHGSIDGKSVSFVLDFEAKEICRCGGLAKKGGFYLKNWKTIDGRPATYSNDRVYSLEFKKRNGIGHP